MGFHASTKWCKPVLRYEISFESQTYDLAAAELETGGADGEKNAKRSRLAREETSARPLFG
jgi:hypothetical protein